MKEFLKHYQKEFIGIIIIISVIGSFFQEGFYIYGVVILTIYFASIYKPKLKEKIHYKKEDRQEEIKEKKDNINNDY